MKKALLFMALPFMIFSKHTTIAFINNVVDEHNNKIPLQVNFDYPDQTVLDLAAGQTAHHSVRSAQQTFALSLPSEPQKNAMWFVNVEGVESNKPTFNFSGTIDLTAGHGAILVNGEAPSITTTGYNVFRRNN